MDDDEFEAETDLDEIKTQIEELESKVEELESNRGSSNSGRNEGCGAVVYAVGSALAVVLSWSRNASIMWGILHGFLGWLYVIYFAFTR